MGGIGLEHHRSSENDYEPDDFIKWDEYGWDRNVDRARAGPQLERQVPPPGGAVDARLPPPMQDNLLWVYEGQDQFWG